MADVKRNAVSSFVDWASELLEDQGKDVTWFGGTQLAPVIEETINSCYRQSLLGEIDVRGRPMLMVELARNKSAVSRVRKCCGKLFSMPSSSRPPNGGFVSTMSTRSLAP